MSWCRDAACAVEHDRHALRPGCRDYGCKETASAPVDHYIEAVTFGHVCKIADRGHDEPHECVCGYKWGASW